MLNLLWIPLSLSAVGLAYAYIKRQDSAKAKKSTAVDRPVSSDTFGISVRLVNTVTTINSYEPMGNVLASLASPQVQKLLGGQLQANMKDYIS